MDDCILSTGTNGFLNLLLYCYFLFTKFICTFCKHNKKQVTTNSKNSVKRLYALPLVNQNYFKTTYVMGL